MSRARRRCSSAALVLVSLALAGCAAAPPPGIEPVSYDRGEGTIRLAMLGRYTMGVFGSGGAGQPAYDPTSRRLFVLNAERGWIDAVDIGDPAAPARVQRHLMFGYGGIPESIALSRGILAVAFANVDGTRPGKVLFFDTDGQRMGDIVRVGVRPVQLRFTPDGHELVVVNHGEANDAYTIDPEGTVSIIDLGIADPACRGAACAIRSRAVQLDFKAFDRQKTGLRRDGVRIYGPGASVAQDLEPESVAIAPDGAMAWVNLQRNNAIAVIDLARPAIERIFALATKDHGRPGFGLDGSSVDGRIHIRPWPIRAFYGPDGFAAYAVAGETFLVTANEGDPRESSGFTEEAQLRTLRLDPEMFPNAAVLQEEVNLGRLRVSRVDGDLDGDGALDEVFAYGGRSFAIWSGAGELIFDSGDDLERIAAAAVPACFNCGGGSKRLDERSDDRGPEPEALALGRAFGRDYVFIAPERIGGLYAYDITLPQAPVFQHYVNFRDFSVDPQRVCAPGRPIAPACAAAGDLEPEGVLFIAAADSPIGEPLVVLTHELSTSATIWRVDALP